jgi:hypothetical protein
MCANQSLVWYASYGSNLLYEDGFLGYIKGEVRRGCSQKEFGCRDRTPPIKNKTIDIPFPLYFAERSSKWNNGGVAFIGLLRDENNPTVGRMYLITKEQFIDVVKQENNNQEISIDFEEVKKAGSKVFRNSWYGNIVYLGEDEGYPIFTFTHHKDIKYQKVGLPSDKYIQIIAAGLKETLNWTEKKIADYLIQKDGIRGLIDKEDFIKKLGE